MLVDNVKRELKIFDLERVHPAWDGLVAKQQLAFEVLGVPAMCVTSETTALEVRSHRRNVSAGNQIVC